MKGKLGCVTPVKWRAFAPKLVRVIDDDAVEPMVTPPSEMPAVDSQRRGLGDTAAAESVRSSSPLSVTMANVSSLPPTEPDGSKLTSTLK